MRTTGTSETTVTYPPATPCNAAAEFPLSTLFWSMLLLIAGVLLLVNAVGCVFLYKQREERMHNLPSGQTAALENTPRRAEIASLRIDPRTGTATDNELLLLRSLVTREKAGPRSSRTD